MIDVMVALIDLLQSDTGVSALVGDHVYGSALPPSEAGRQPSKAVVLRYAGGGGSAPGSADYLDLAEQRVDVYSYGETMYEADKVRRAVHSALKSINRVIMGPVLVHRANWAAGPITFMDPDTDWPAMVETWNVMAAESAVTV